ncbi:MAG: hypothetical protein HZB33_06025 [Nitrospirae bacterium]|nr:hypothetical protein [Nitrospirota bacterium]
MEMESPFAEIASSDCCSSHGGIASCSGGYYWCNDGTRSPGCTCSSVSPTPTPSPAPTHPFPASHPSNAISGSFVSSGGEVDGFFWTESGNTWVEFVPVKSTFFVCSASFYIIQDKFKFDTVKFETGAGSSFCQNLTKATVLKLTQWSFETKKADLNREFTLGLDLTTSSGQIYEVVVPTPGLPPFSECAGHIDSVTGYIYLPCFDYDGKRYRINLGIHSTDPIVLLDIKDVTVIP